MRVEPERGRPIMKTGRGAGTQRPCALEQLACEHLPDPLADLSAEPCRAFL